MMKLLFFSDLHAHNYNQFSTRTENGFNSRLVDCVNIIEQAKNVCVDEGVYACFFLGDLFHARTKVDLDVFSLIWNKLKELSVATHLYLLEGNHDQANRLGTVNSLFSFSPFATVLDSPCDFSVIDNSAWIRVGAIPHVADKDEFAEKVKNVPAACHILLLHQAFAEAEIGSSNSFKRDMLSKDLVSSRKHVLCGDIHKPQTIGNITYIGSPLQLNFGERGEEKRFLLMEWKNEECTIKSVPVHGPKFHWFEIGENESNFDLTGVDIERDFVRVTYDQKHQNKIRTLSEQFPRMSFEMKDSKERIYETRVSDDVANDDVMLMREYVEQLCPDSMEKQKLLELGIKHLTESR